MKSYRFSNIFSSFSGNSYNLKLDGTGQPIRASENEVSGGVVYV